MPQMRAVVKGIVQGVNFRRNAAIRARALSLTGWVSNRADGSVETLAIGPHAALQEYVLWLHEGPSAARVDHVDIQWADVPTESHDSFDIYFDAR